MWIADTDIKIKIKHEVDIFIFNCGLLKSYANQLDDLSDIGLNHDSIHTLVFFVAKKFGITLFELNISFSDIEIVEDIYILIEKILNSNIGNKKT